MVAAARAGWAPECESRRASRCLCSNKVLEARIAVGLSNQGAAGRLDESETGLQDGLATYKVTVEKALAELKMKSVVLCDVVSSPAELENAKAFLPPRPNVASESEK
jgi:hypothetical protein